MQSYTQCNANRIKRWLYILYSMHSVLQIHRKSEEKGYREINENVFLLDFWLFLLFVKQNLILISQPISIKFYQMFNYFHKSLINCFIKKFSLQTTSTLKFLRHIIIINLLSFLFFFFLGGGGGERGGWINYFTWLCWLATSLTSPSVEVNSAHSLYLTSTSWTPV